MHCLGHDPGALQVGAQLSVPPVSRPAPFRVCSVQAKDSFRWLLPLNQNPMYFSPLQLETQTLNYHFRLFEIIGLQTY